MNLGIGGEFQGRIRKWTLDCPYILTERAARLSPYSVTLRRKDQAVRALVKKGNEFLLLTADRATDGFGLSENP